MADDRRLSLLENGVRLVPELAVDDGFVLTGVGDALVPLTLSLPQRAWRRHRDLILVVSIHARPVAIAVANDRPHLSSSGRGYLKHRLDRLPER
jgi:hypothetical protein